MLQRPLVQENRIAAYAVCIEEKCPMGVLKSSRVLTKVSKERFLENFDLRKPIEFENGKPIMLFFENGKELSRKKAEDPVGIQQVFKGC